MGVLKKFKRAVKKLTKPIKRAARKLVPKEAAGIMQMAAPFVAPYNPWVAGAMHGLGSLKQRGKINPLMLALATAPGWGTAGGTQQGYIRKLTRNTENTLGIWKT